MDEVALQAMLQQHPGRVAWEVEAGGRSKEWRKGQRAIRHRVKRKTRKTMRLRSFGHQFSIIGRQSGGEEQGGQGLPPRRERGMEEVCGMDVEDEIESRKKLDEQKRKLQELRDVEKLSSVSKEVQDSLKNDLQQPLQEVEQKEA